MYISIRGSEFESEPMEKSSIIQESVSESKSETKFGNGNKPLHVTFSTLFKNGWNEFPRCCLHMTLKYAKKIKGGADKYGSSRLIGVCVCVCVYMYACTYSVHGGSVCVCMCVCVCVLTLYMVG